MNQSNLDGLSCLKGLTFTGIYANDSGTIFAFVNRKWAAANFLFLAESDGDSGGECCLRHITSVKNLIGTPILEVEEREIINSTKRLRDGNVIDIWGYTLKTKKGYSFLEMIHGGDGKSRGNLQLINKAPLCFFGRKVFFKDGLVLEELKRYVAPFSEIKCYTK